VKTLNISPDSQATRTPIPGTLSERKKGGGTSFCLCFCVVCVCVVHAHMCVCVLDCVRACVCERERVRGVCVCVRVISPRPLTGEQRKLLHSRTPRQFLTSWPQAAEDVSDYFMKLLLLESIISIQIEPPHRTADCSPRCLLRTLRNHGPPGAGRPIIDVYIII
jgi:hypothetical protein